MLNIIAGIGNIYFLPDGAVMLDNIKYLMCLKSADKHVADREYELALEKLNYLIGEEFRPSETFLKRGKLCKKLLMLEDAYSDFTYIINHCVNKRDAYYERLKLNFEISNYIEAIRDADVILKSDENNFEVKRIKFLSFIYSSREDIAKDYILKIFDYNKYQTIQFLFKEVAVVLSKDEFAKGLKLLNVIDMIDKDNPVKLLKEANIYGFAKQTEKQREIMDRIDKVFPKYFISHFRFTDMYQDKDLMEICFLLELKIFDKQNLFAYPMQILEGYKNHIEGHIIDSKECFERAIGICPHKPEAYVLLAQTLQLMSGYDNPEYKHDAEENYKIAMDIYKKESLIDKAEEMKRQIKHLNSGVNIYS